MLLAGGVAAIAAAVAVVVATQVGDRPTQLRTAPAAYTDLLVERAAFGWLPRGMHANRYIADHQGPHFFEVSADAGKAGSVTLTAYAPGKEPMLPYLPGRVRAKRIRAAPINGRTAYWISKPNPSGQSSFELRWQYAPKSWANLQGVGLHGTTAELTRTAYKIARSATFGGTRPIAMPLHVDGVPGGLTPSRTVLNKDVLGEVSASMSFIVAGPSSFLSIDVIKSTGAFVKDPPNTKLGGYSAFRTPKYLLVYGVNGFDVTVNATGSVLAKLNKTGGIAGLFHRTTVLGTDEANWTTNPVN
ncbi:hypothetical protein [Actinomadura alba]|uniref:Uncharacterized protein n=1 Tax=Actinomadura alba TaxID=406431 RepID=A0ABR7LPA3_9ACTN|nr:hypothetical protein [Actinomadura alba]MBC6466685.1 hypothetical protein [Actinomadura alba]